VTLSDEEIIISDVLGNIFKNRKECSNLNKFFIIMNSHFQYLIGNKIHFIQYMFFQLYSSVGVLALKNYQGKSSFFKLPENCYFVQK